MVAVVDVDFDFAVVEGNSSDCGVGLYSGIVMYSDSAHVVSLL